MQDILATAERLKHTSALKSEISSLIESPPEEFVRMISQNLYEGRFTSAVKEQFTGLVRSAFREVIRDTVKNRLTFALADNEPEVEAVTEADEEEIVTTDEEREGFMIVRAIVREVIPASRIVMRDARSYCAILVDNNNRKPLTRLTSIARGNI